MTNPAPQVHTPAGTVEGVWRENSAAFLGIPFAEPPVGDLRFAAPQPKAAWSGVLAATRPGATPQRRPFGPVTTIPEPSYPGDSTLNVNVFTPAPGSDARLPVLVWIHGGGFFAGSPSSPWYDGAAFNRDGVVTVSISYRLGFEGFGWIADAPTNRGLLDQIEALRWVRRSIAAFGGDPDRVTIAGQSAGGASVLALMSSPLARGLFQRAIPQSGAALELKLERAEQIGRDFAANCEVEPTMAGWSARTEEQVLDAGRTDLGVQPTTPAEFVRGVLDTGGLSIPFLPVIGDDVLPEPISVRDSAVAMLAGATAHEFTLMTAGAREAWAGVEPSSALVDGGLPEPVAREFMAGHPDLTGTADLCGQLLTDLSFRVPLMEWADSHRGDTWVYDFRWSSPVIGQSVHCLELPFTWDLLAAEGVAAVCGPTPPRELADVMHAAWVAFIRDGDPGWSRWDGSNPQVFGGVGDGLRAERALADLIPVKA